MGALRNLRHEKFAREYVKTGVGGHAYARVYNRRLPDDTCYNNAARLLGYASVKSRVNELREAYMKRADITIDKILSDYQDALEMANHLEKPGDIISAATAQAKLVGLLRDRIEQGKPTDFDYLDSPQSLLQELHELVGTEQAKQLATLLKLSQPNDQSTTDTNIQATNNNERKSGNSDSPATHSAIQLTAPGTDSVN